MARGVLVTQKFVSRMKSFGEAMDLDVGAAFLVILGCVFLWRPGFQSCQKNGPSIEIETSHDPMILVDISPHTY